MTSILLSRLPQVEKKLVSLNKRAIKRGLEPFSLEIGEVFTKEIDWNDQRVVLDYIKVEIVGELPSIPGYKLLGTKNIIDDITLFFGDFPMKHKNDENCDHCNTKRARNFIAAVEKDEKILLIGSTCFKHVFDSVVAGQLISFGNSLNMIEEFADEDFEGGSYSPNGIYQPRNFISIAVGIIDKSGYVSKAQDDVNNTCEDIISNYGSIESQEERHLAKADLVLEYYKNLEPKSAFDSSMKSVLESQYITDKHAGLAAYAYVGYQKSIEGDKAKVDIKAQNQLSEYVGTIKKREDFELELINISSFAGEWGTTYYYTFKIGDNVVCWKASRCIYWIVDIEIEDKDGHKWTDHIDHYAEIGDIITLKGTVTKHEVYKNEKFGDRKTTHISRCKLLAVTREGEKLF